MGSFRFGRAHSCRHALHDERKLVNTTVLGRICVWVQPLQCTAWFPGCPATSAALMTHAHDARPRHLGRSSAQLLFRNSTATPPKEFNGEHVGQFIWIMGLYALVGSARQNECDVAVDSWHAQVSSPPAPPRPGTAGGAPKIATNYSDKYNHIH